MGFLVILCMPSNWRRCSPNNTAYPTWIYLSLQHMPTVTLCIADVTQGAATLCCPLSRVSIRYIPRAQEGHLCSSSGACQHVLHYRRYPSWLNMGDRCDRGSLAKQSLCLLAPRQTRVDKGEQGMCRALAQPAHLSERGVMTGKHQS